jgi:hypothetical protein
MSWRTGVQGFNLTPEFGRTRAHQYSGAGKQKEIWQQQRACSKIGTRGGKRRNGASCLLDHGASAAHA